MNLKLKKFIFVAAVILIILAVLIFLSVIDESSDSYVYFLFISIPFIMIGFFSSLLRNQEIILNHKKLAIATLTFLIGFCWTFIDMAYLVVFHKEPNHKMILLSSFLYFIFWSYTKVNKKTESINFKKSV